MILEILIAVYLVSVFLTVVMITYDSIKFRSYSNNPFVDFSIFLFIILFPVANTISAIAFLCDVLEEIKLYMRRKDG